MTTLENNNLVSFKDWKDHHEEEEDLKNFHNPLLTTVYISLGKGKEEKKFAHEFSTEFISLKEMKKLIISNFEDKGINIKLCDEFVDEEVGLLFFEEV
jgi:hypothetical protein